MESAAHRLTFCVIDDHESALGGTVSALAQVYPDARICTATTAQDGQQQVPAIPPDLLIIDLALPPVAGATAQPSTGIALLRTLMTHCPDLNIVVQSAHVRSLVRLKPMIDTHRGGFTIVDKGLPLTTLLEKVEWALQGAIYLPGEMRLGIEVQPEWLQVLQLAFERGFQDKLIAQHMNLSERTIRHYWQRLQAALNVDPTAGENRRIRTAIQARAAGLID